MTMTEQNQDPVLMMTDMVGALVGQWVEQSIPPVQMAEQFVQAADFLFIMRDEPPYSQYDPSIDEWLEVARLLEVHARKIRGAIKRTAS